MGLGDWVMAAGEARKVHAKTGRKVMIVDRVGRVQWSEVFENNPYIVKTNVFGAERMLNCGGYRPYIAGKTATRWTWKPYSPRPAELFFTDAERSAVEHYRGAVMLEPNVKANGHTNKAWPWMRWVALAIELRALGHRVVQCGPDGAMWLPAERIATRTFRQAAAVQSVASLFIGTEGGLHHAAAANNIPAIVLWSEFIAPEITGYVSQVNLRHAGKPCGNRLNCRGCQLSMEAITIDEVLNAVKEVLK